MNANTRKRLFERDGGVCWHCGSDQVTVQHRVNRGIGGSKVLDNPANLILLCWFSNFEMEASSRAAKSAELAGWKVSRYVDPKTVRVFHYPSGEWFLLDDLWNRHQVI